MAGIETYLNQIKNAIYGKDVRQAIHDGIEQCYKDGKAGAIDLVARQRIDEFTHLEDGSTTGDAELADIRVDNGGGSYASAGDAVRGQTKSIQNGLFDREFNVINFIKKTSGTHKGVSYTWNDDGSCTVVGTATATSYNRFFYNLTGFPPFLKSGMPLMIKIESTTPNSQVRFSIFKCENGELGSTWVSVDGATPIHNSIIPEGLSGLMMRIQAPTGVAVNETIRISVVPQDSMINVPNSKNVYVSDANEARRNGLYFVSVGDGFEYENFPYEAAAGWLEVECIGEHTDTGVLQIFYPWNATNYDVQWRTSQRGIWTEWKQLGSGGGGGGDTIIENTYNITTSPHITTDDNGWLQAVDTDTASETGKTDMTGAIMSMLTDTGYCKLSKGIFYVSGSIDMPEGSTLEGCGEDTIIRLLSSTESGYCVKVTKFNTVKGIRFSGGRSDYEPTSTIGTRNGIHYTANADGTGASMPAIEQCVIDNCWFENFSGSAIYCSNTGGSVGKPLMVSNCFINRCTAGINIAYYSEYQKYTNVVVTHCYYACINNGGNNVFTACTFHGTIGFSMDGSRNSAHGSVVGCTFNHIDNWNRPSTHGGGTAILISNAANGFIFTGCQIWYGAIDVRGSRGIAFSDCLFGGNSPEISVTGSLPAFFANCIFHATPTLNVNESTKFDNCYLDEDGSPITA